MGQKSFFDSSRAGTPEPGVNSDREEAAPEAPGASGGAPAPGAAGGTAGPAQRKASAKAAPKTASKGRAKGKGAGKVTPMMEQFQRAKKDAPGCVLFFRMGDFYELFGEDAVLASRELGLTLTARDKGSNAMPMAGVPVRAYETYLMRLVAKGFKVAICEQLQDPRTTKGIVDRGVVRIVTPGTITEEDALDAKASNYLASAWVGRSHGKDEAALAWVDLSTGAFHAAEVTPGELEDLLARVAPAELLWPASLDERWERAGELRHRLGPRVTERDDWRFERDGMRRALTRHFGVKTLEGYGFADDSPVVSAAGALVEYLAETQRASCDHVRRIQKVEPRAHLVLDQATRTTLELVQTQRGERREGTLLDAVDRTHTPMGGRAMREWLLAPLTDVDAIRRRQAGVSELVAEPFLREEVRRLLDDVLDVERLVAKLSTGRANGRDLVALAGSLAVVGPLKLHLATVGAPVLRELEARLDALEDVVGRVRRTLVDAPPMTIKEGGLVRDGVDAQLDEYRQIAGDGKTWMARFQAAEVERTGIANLRIGYNSVFGYFLEVPRGQVGRVPPHYVRKQTIKTCERYVTDELKQFETKVLKSEELARDLEYDLFCALRDAVHIEVARVLDTAAAMAEVDVLAGLAQVAAEEGWCAPEVDDGGAIEVLEGRHPVIEQSAVCEAFVPNDTRMDGGARRLSILTGPNMAGKSTYIRQTALIVLLAQVGAWVPAAEARVGVTDRIFTRIGSGDDISRGASTFMVEMVEIANILNNATPRSLVVLDEVGRGTSTFDGLALAWALVEHLHDAIGARTLFATHYHQLTELEGVLEGVRNLNVAVRESGDEITFLHRIVEGGTDRSYGVHVARLAGVPGAVLQRAKAILDELEADAKAARTTADGRPAPHADQPHASEPLASATPAGPSAEAGAALLVRLRALDPDRMTPLQALTALQELRELAD